VPLPQQHLQRRAQRCCVVSAASCPRRRGGRQYWMSPLCEGFPGRNGVCDARLRCFADVVERQKAKRGQPPRALLHSRLGGRPLKPTSAAAAAVAANSLPSSTSSSAAGPAAALAVGLGPRFNWLENKIHTMQATSTCTAQLRPPLSPATCSEARSSATTTTTTSTAAVVVASATTTPSTMSSPLTTVPLHHHDDIVTTQSSTDLR